MLQYLVPLGGLADPRFGVLTSWRHFGIVLGVRAGRPWAADNGAFSGGFDARRFLAQLERLRPHAATCLFVAAPDVFADARATLASFDEWAEALGSWPVAYVAQDGQEDLELPRPGLWDVLFVGGSTSWKLSAAAVSVIRRAQRLGKRIHVGRVNYRTRYRYFRYLAEEGEGPHEWTCDGTRNRFEGPAQTLDAWAGYMAEPAPTADEFTRVLVPRCRGAGELEHGGVGTGRKHRKRVPAGGARPGDA